MGETSPDSTLDYNMGGQKDSKICMNAWRFCNASHARVALSQRLCVSTHPLGRRHRLGDSGDQQTAVAARRYRLGAAQRERLGAYIASTWFSIVLPRGCRMRQGRPRKNHHSITASLKAENTIRRLKIFRILKKTYRNKRKAYGQKVNIIAGLVNLRAGYAWSPPHPKIHPSAQNLSQTLPIAFRNILIADEDFRVGERGKAEGVDIRSMTEAAGVAQPAGSLQVRWV
jgi:hypothetical protein